LGALAYRSAKKRKLGEAKASTARTVIEVALLLAICVIVLAQKNLKELIATDPFNNVLIPLWAIVAYLVLILTPGWPIAETASPTLSALTAVMDDLNHLKGRNPPRLGKDTYDALAFAALLVVLGLVAAWFAAWWTTYGPPTLGNFGDAFNAPSHSCEPIFVGKQCVLHAQESSPAYGHSGRTVTVMGSKDMTDVMYYYVRTWDGWQGTANATELFAVP
jgi:hypothetical protein